MKKILFLILGATFFLVACNSNSDLLSVNNSGHISLIDEESFDWGDVDITGGEVEHGFHFRNDGNEDLVLRSAITSCMCTSAKYELPDGSLSPTFGMHGGSENWAYAVKPGEEFELEVTFDPMAHGPDAVGPIQRSINMNSSDGNGPFEVHLSANVLSHMDYEAKYSGADFVFDDSEYDFGIVKQSGGVVSKDFSFTYVGEDPIKVTALPSSCGCTSALISQNDFVNGDKGTVTVNFDPNLHEEPAGKFFKTVTLLTDPALEKQPELKIWAEIDVDLGPDAYTLKEEHED